MTRINHEHVYAEALHRINQLRPGDLVAFNWTDDPLEVVSVEPTETGLVHVTYTNGWHEITDPELVVTALFEV